MRVTCTSQHRFPRRLWQTWLIPFLTNHSFQPYDTCCYNFGSGLVEPGSQKLGLPGGLIKCSHAYVSCVVPKTSHNERVRYSRFSTSKTASLLLVETDTKKYSNRLSLQNKNISLQRHRRYPARLLALFDLQYRDQFCNFLISKLATSFV